MKDFPYTEKKDTRSGFGAGLLELGRTNPNVVGLCADLTGSLKMGDFQKEFPENLQISDEKVRFIIKRLPKK